MAGWLAGVRALPRIIIIKKSERKMEIISLIRGGGGYPLGRGRRSSYLFSAPRPLLYQNHAARAHTGERGARRYKY